MSDKLQISPDQGNVEDCEDANAAEEGSDLPCDRRMCSVEASYDDWQKKDAEKETGEDVKHWSLHHGWIGLERVRMR